ncbi:hypothetical protein ASQ50_19275 [Marinobacter sp. LQ44]|nr:hypothetical protein ASQ50_19275 [Marinobacter sp. LQ44]
MSINGQDSLVEPAICHAVITMAQSLGMQVIAEGIETGEQLESLAEMSCSHGQGYMIAKPMPSESALAFALNHNNATIIADDHAS